MPSPNDVRGPFLKYLRNSLPLGKYYVDADGVFSAAEVRKAIKMVEAKDAALHRILDRYITTRNPRSKIAEAESYDSSTIKRKLDHALNMVLQNLKMMSRPVPDLTKVVPKAEPSEPVELTMVIPKAESHVNLECQAQ